MGKTFGTDIPSIHSGTSLKIIPIKNNKANNFCLFIKKRKIYSQINLFDDEGNS